MTAVALSTHEGAARGRLIELLLVGGATLLAFPLAWAARAALGLDDAELAVGFSTFYAAYLVNDPHFSVTYLLFYKDVRRRALSTEIAPAQRARYVVSGFVVPAMLVAWAACALAWRSAQALGWMVQLMYLLVGWHYGKQGFGVLSVLSARRGARFAAGERRAILAHVYAAWAFSWANPATSAGEFEEKGVVYWAPARPAWLEVVTGLALLATTVAMVTVLLRRARRAETPVPRGPLVAFLVTIWAWTIFSSVDPVVRYLVPFFHSVQYLYFVWLMTRNEARAHEGPPTFGRPVKVRLGVLALSAVALGWVLFHGLPSFLDAAIVPRWGRGAGAEPLGPTPFVAAFFVVVSIHHYFMDHVVWRRENPDTRWLTA